MIVRDYDADLQAMFSDIERINSRVAKECQSIYQNENLSFNNQCFRSIEGDIFAKVLGLYLQCVLNRTPVYEQKLVGRMRADIQFTKEAPKKVIIEVKSHGTFSYKDLDERFKKITVYMPDSKHIYVAFRERIDYVTNTEKILQKYNVDTFFLSTYEHDVNKTKYYPESLERLVKTIHASI